MELLCGNRQRIEAVGRFRRGAPTWMLDKILNATLLKNSLHLHQTLATFLAIFGDIPEIFWGYFPNVWQHSREYLATFPRMFSNIPRNVWKHSPECMTTFLEIFENVPRNVWGHSPEGLATFPGRFGDIPPCVPRVLFPDPVFLVLCIACINICKYHFITVFHNYDIF